MEYALLIYMDESELTAATPEQIEGHADAFAVYVRELMDRGVIRGGVPLQPRSVATTVQVRDGKTLTTDGPFMETKEGLAGFYLVEAKDLDEAIELASKIPAAHVGSIEVRPVWQQMVDMVGKRVGA
jgi:hypothetical protein